MDWDWRKYQKGASNHINDWIGISNYKFIIYHEWDKYKFIHHVFVLTPLKFVTTNYKSTAPRVR